MCSEDVFRFVVAVNVSGKEIDSYVAFDAMLDESVSPGSLRSRGTADARPCVHGFHGARGMVIEFPICWLPDQEFSIPQQRRRGIGLTAAGMGKLASSSHLPDNRPGMERWIRRSQRPLLGAITSRQLPIIESEEEIVKDALVLARRDAKQAIDVHVDKAASQFPHIGV